MFRNGIDPMLPTRCVRAGEYRTSASRLDVDDLLGAEGLPAQRRRTDRDPEVRVLMNVIERAAERRYGHIEHPGVLVVELDEMMRLPNGGHLHFRCGHALGLCSASERSDTQDRAAEFSH